MVILVQDVVHWRVHNTDIIICATHKDLAYDKPHANAYIRPPIDLPIRYLISYPFCFPTLSSASL